MAEKKKKLFNPDEPAFGREYDPGLTKREYIILELFLAQISNGRGASDAATKRAVEDGYKTIVDAYNEPA